MTLSKIKSHPLVFKWVQKSGKQYTFHLLLHFLIFTIIFFGIIQIHFSIQSKRICEEFTAYDESLSYPLSSSSVDKLNTYLNNAYLPDNEKGICSERLYNYYFSTQEHSLAFEYIGHALYYYGQADNHYALALTQLNLAQAMISISAFNNAKTIIQDVLTLEIDDPNQHSAIQYYCYITLADIHSRDGSVSDALNCLELSKQYQHTTENLISEYGYLAQVVQARCYLLQKDYGSCNAILSTLPTFLSTTPSPLFSTHISYLDVYSKYLLAIGELDDALMKTRSLTSYCEKHNYKNLELQHLADIITLCRIYQIDDIRIDAYELILSAEYPELLQSCTESLATFISYSFHSLNQSISVLAYANQLQSQILMQFVLILVIILIFLLIIKQSVDKNRVDGLTGIYNRHHFDYTYNTVMINHMPFSIIMFDIDNFKRCNDTYGHQFGDEVLAKVSQTIKKLLPNDCWFYRYGGEEFCIICSNTSPETTCQLAEHIRETIQSLSWSQDTTITISLGIADNTSSEEPLGTADERLYYSKANGKNRYTYC